MNEKFSITRFGNLLRKRYVENGRIYLYGTALAAGILALALLIGFEGPEISYVYFVLVFAFAQGTMVQYEMKPLRDKHTGPVTGTLPVSRGENYALVWMNTVVVLSAILTGVYLLITGIYAALSPTFAFVQFIPHKELLQGAIPFFLLVNSVAMHAAATRIRNQMWAFAAVAFGLLLLFSPAVILTTCTMQHHMEFGFLLNNVELYTMDTDNNVMKAWVETRPCIDGMSHNHVFCVMYLTAAVLWITAYLKFKNRQIG